MYKSMQVYEPIKTIVQELKKEMKLKNESEVVAYLYCLYKNRYESITLEEHRKAIHDANKFLK